tara:strand:+ start:1182 stop:1574 length:393 start_codon:yes stop_codon:yes gene_type:complete
MKKAQSQIITTVLIILLVLAAIVIVWQVVNSTVRGGAEEVEAQAECLGLTTEITVNSVGVIQVVPSKAVGSLTIYADGELIHTSTGAVAAGVSEQSLVNAGDGEVISAAGTINDQLCPGLNDITASVAVT